MWFSYTFILCFVRFSEQVESGLIEVISPPASYYPDMDNLKESLGDPPERVRWRTKQNLDFAFLMMYSQPKATFYVQLEDDILAKKNFISTMKNYALQKISEKSPWFVLEFCQLGFIGEFHILQQDLTVILIRCCFVHLDLALKYVVLIDSLHYARTCSTYLSF